MQGRYKNVQKLNHGQRGLALLLFAILISMISITLYFNSISVIKLKNEQKKSYSELLSDAKRALLAYAITYVDSNTGEHGFLPCPDINDKGFYEGGSDSPCGDTGKSAAGQFPWASLDTGIMKTGSGSCLWYAVSGDYKSSPKTKMLNEDTNGLFRLFRQVRQYDEDGDEVTGEILIAGNQPQDRLVALIIDPGRPLDAQPREYTDESVCGLDYDAAHFLEGNGNIDNSVFANAADSIDDFIHADDGGDQIDTLFNDRIVYITRDELWRHVLARTDFATKMQTLTRALAECLVEYANTATAPNRRLPWPAPYDFAGADYRDSNNYSDVNAPGYYAGRFPYNVDNSSASMPITVPPLPVPPPDPLPVESEYFFKLPYLCSSPPVSVDLNDKNGEYRKLWDNWKDHFFYVLSKPYEPGATGEAECSAGNCININSGGINTPYAGIVIFAGSRRAGQLRSAPPLGGDPDEKAIVSNYLEENRAAFFPNATGQGSLNAVDTGNSNDFIYCITNEGPGVALSATPC